MSDFYKLIKHCETLKTNDKTEYVRLNANYSAKRILLYMLEETLFTFNVKGINKKVDPIEWTPIETDEDLAQSINVLLGYNLNKSKELDGCIHGMWEACTPELREVFEWVLKRKNPAKVGVSITNSVWSRLIHVQYYMGAKPGTPEALEKLVGPYLVQRKEDGECWTILATFVPNGVPIIEIRTRQGNNITEYFPIAVHKTKVAFSQFMNAVAYDGRPYVCYEAMMLNDDGTWMRRESANGLFNKMTSGLYDSDIDESIRLVAWDICDFNKVEKTKKDPMPVEERYEYLKDLAAASYGFITAVESVQVATIKEARAIARMYIAQGGEGAILKVVGKGWSNGKPSYILKLKNEMEAEGMIIGWNPHSENPCLIGSFIISSSCGGMITSCGSGLNDKLRLSLNFDDVDGAIIPIRCEELTTSKGKDTVAMKHPRVLTDDDGNMVIRLDKREADSLEEMYEIERAAKGMK